MAIIYPFSKKTVEFLRTPPTPGNTHPWIFGVALRLKDFMDPDALFALLREEVTRVVHHRDIPDREIRAAIESALQEQGEDIAPVHTSIPWPAKDSNLIASVIGEFKPVPFESGASAKDVIPLLFRPADLICYGPSQEISLSATPAELAPFACSQQFIVPNPLKAKKGLTKSGRVSARCQNNILERRYLVTEFDDVTLGKENQAKILTALSHFRPLAMVVDSGGKSLHGWFVADGKEGENLKFYAGAVALGADPTRWDPCGWVRMPGGTRPRESGAVEQKILFLDIQALEGAAS